LGVVSRGGVGAAITAAAKKKRYKMNELTIVLLRPAKET
jgi:hypothetical protein